MGRDNRERHLFLNHGTLIKFCMRLLTLQQIPTPSGTLRPGTEGSTLKVVNLLDGELGKLETEYEFASSMNLLLVKSLQHCQTTALLKDCPFLRG